MSVKKKLDLAIGGYRNMQSHSSVFKAEIVIAMLFNHRPGRKLQQSYGAQRTLECFEQGAKVGAALQQRRGSKWSRRMRIGIAPAGNAIYCTQGDAAPLSLVKA